ncbi:MAG: beta strand repeat-containing protein [Bacteroidales bacterium]
MRKTFLFLSMFFCVTCLFAQNIGIGESNPASKISTKGNLSVGTNYSTTAAPANGAIIEGNVGIGTTAPDASAKLDITASDKGLLIPRVALSATNVAAPVIAPATSLVVYNTTSTGGGVTSIFPGFYYWDGTQWVRILDNDNDMQSLSFNAGTGDLSISNGNTVNIPQVVDTDNQTLTYNNVTGDLTIVDGNTVNLNALKDHDWYEVGTTTAPDNINDNKYTLGRIAIGSLNPTNYYKLMVDSGMVYINGGTPTANLCGVSSSFIGWPHSGLQLGNESDYLGMVLERKGLDDHDGIIYFSGEYPSDALRFCTAVWNGSTHCFNEKARIMNDGSFGIGTNAPTAQLHTTSSVRFAGLSTNNANINIVSSDASGNLAWRDASTLAGNDWHITGNNAIDPDLHFLGTINNVALIIKTNDIKSGEINPNGTTILGYEAGLVNAGTQNTFIGSRAGFANIGGSYNTAVGNNAMAANTTGANNTAFGMAALIVNTTGSFNSAIGVGTLSNNTGGYSNVAVGIQALLANTAGYQNTAVGVFSQTANSTGNSNVSLGSYSLRDNTVNNNTAIGHFAMQTSTTGTNNVAIGKSAMQQANASNNVGIGFNSLYFATNGSNTAIGSSALYLNTVGTNNVAVGTDALRANTIGIRNVAAGANASLLSTIANNNVTIGESAARNNTVAGQNIAIGSDALLTQSFNNASVAFSSNNVAIGYQALRVNQPTSTLNGINNVAIGSNSLDANTTGNRNIGVGTDALGANTSGVANVAVGRDALQANTTTSQNTALGTEALKLVVGGTNNTAIGYQANNIGISGSNNTFLGSNVAQNNAASDNIAIGSSALNLNTVGTQNVVIGTGAGQNSIGSRNVLIGYQAGQNELGSDKLYIESSNAAAPLIGGDFVTNKVGINAMPATNTLYINGGPLHTANSWTGSIELNTANAIEWKPNVSSKTFGMGYTTNGFYMFNALDNLGAVANPAEYRMIIHNNGGTSIGSNMGGGFVPNAPLHVEGFMMGGASNFAFYAYNGTANTGTFSGATDVTIYATNRVRASEFNAFSDARIKNINGISNADKDLFTLSQIQVTDYTHIDVVGKGKDNKKGFIAQQVETIYPEAVSKAKDFIPNVYDIASKIIYQQVNEKEGNLIVTLNKKHDFKNGDIVKVIADKAYEQSVNIIDDKTFIINNWKIDTKELFVYGKQVDDFRAVDYDRIFTLNVSATQALLKKVEALEKQNSALMQRVETLEANNREELSRR